MAQHALKGGSLKAGGNRVQHRDRNAITHAQSAETEAPGAMQRIVELFQLVPDPKERYKQLLHYASKLEALPEELHAPQFKVEGCVSQVWVVPEYDTQHNALTYRADSDSQLTKGLAALLCNGLSGAPPEQIMQMSPNFIENLGLKQSLTPSRNNGFLNMFRKMQRQAAELHAEGCDNNGGQNGYLGNNNNDSNSSTPVADSIKRKLEADLQPQRLNVVDESAAHAGHEPVGNLSRSTETHFTCDEHLKQIEVVSKAFEGKRKVQRHRTVYSLLDDEIKGGIHALSLDLKAPSEAGS